MARWLMSTWVSLIWSMVKPSNKAGNLAHWTVLVLITMRSAFRRPRQYSPVNFRMVRMTVWIEYQFSI